MKTDCVLLGTSFPGTGDFSIVAVVPTPTPRLTPTPTWSITGSVGDPVPLGGTVVFTGHVTGNPPVGIAPIDLRCELVVAVGTDQIAYVQDGSVQTRDFQLAAPLAAGAHTGPATWKVSCFSTAPGSRSISGTLQVG